ncbi:MAG: RNase H family protein [archaeon]
MKIWSDGGGWNGRLSRYAVVFEDGRSIVEDFPEEKTNNEMEYAGLIRALKEASADDEIIVDSQLLVGHVTKGWKVNFAHLRPLVDESKRLVAEKNITLSWVRRDGNKAGILIDGLK